MLVHVNASFALADELSPLFKEIFSDSQIAAGYASKCTKTTCIVNGALKKRLRSKLVEIIKTKPYSLAIDGSNDSGLLKMNPLTVRVFTNDGISTQLLDVGFTTKQLLRKLIEDGLDNRQIKKFYSGVRKFYVKVLNYGRSRLPFDDLFLKMQDS